MARAPGVLYVWIRHVLNSDSDLGFYLTVRQAAAGINHLTTEMHHPVF